MRARVGLRCVAETAAVRGPAATAVEKVNRANSARVFAIAASLRACAGQDQTQRGEGEPDRLRCGARRVARGAIGRGGGTRVDERTAPARLADLDPGSRPGGRLSPFRPPHRAALRRRRWVRNRRDRAVELVVAGAADRIEATLAELRRGPLGAHVLDFRIVSVDEKERPIGFEIRGTL